MPCQARLRDAAIQKRRAGTKDIWQPLDPIEESDLAIVLELNSEKRFF